MYVSQVAASRIAEKEAEPVARIAEKEAEHGSKSKSTEQQTDSESDLSCNVDAEESSSGAGNAKTKPKRASRKSKPKEKTLYFAKPGDMHIFLRRTTMFWNTSIHAVDICEAAYHPDRLKLARTAVEAFNMLGLREEASKIFVGEFMIQSLFDAACHADKVIMFHM